MVPDSTWFGEGAESPGVHGPCGLGLLAQWKAAARRAQRPGAGRARPAPSPGALVLCLKAGLPSLSLHLASTVTAKSKKPSNGARETSPLSSPPLITSFQGTGAPV